MAVIHYYVHGRGRGHASRARTVVGHLRSAGHAVKVFAGGRALDLLDGPLAARAPILPGPSSVPRLVARAARDIVRLRSDRPTIIATDGDQAAILAAEALGLPTIAVGHGLVFSGCRLPKGLPRVPLARERLNGLIPARWARHRVAVHFLPIAPAAKNVVVARPDLSEITLEDVSDGGFFVAYLDEPRGPQVLKALATKRIEVRAFGGSGAPFERAGFRQALRQASAVVTTAGSNVLAECVALGKPVFALFPSAHAEQSLNASLVEQAGVGIAASFESFSSDEGDRRARRFVRSVSAGAYRRVPLMEALPSLSEVFLELVRGIEAQALNRG